MSVLPRISGAEICKALKKIGYEFDHQSGSHMILRNIYPPYRRITIPNHPEVAKGTLRKIIREVGLTVGQFRGLV